MDEQNEGSKTILESLERLRSVRQDVEIQSEELRGAGNAILQETSTLVDLTDGIRGGMNEIAVGTKEISAAVEGITEMSRTNSRSIRAVNDEVSRFIVDGNQT